MNSLISAKERYADQDPKWFPPLEALYSDEHRRLIHNWRAEAERWLSNKGISQYTAGPHSKSATSHERIDRLFDAGQFVGQTKDGHLTAVVAITEPDPDFWTPAEVSEPQGYLTHFHVGEHGHFHGTQLLFAVMTAETRRGSHWLRLDCWRGNTKLHEYYLRHHFERVRSVIVPGRSSGELFQYDLTQPGMAAELDSPRRPRI